MTPSPPVSVEVPTSVGGTSTGILRLGMRVYEKTFSFPQSLSSCCAVAASSSNNTSRKFAAPELGLPSLDLFQHLSSECPRPEQKEHLIPQFSVLCGMPHLAHFGRGSICFGHDVATWSLPLQTQHSLNWLGEKGGIEFGTPPLKKLINVLFKLAT